MIDNNKENELAEEAKTLCAYLNAIVKGTAFSTDDKLRMLRSFNRNIEQNIMLRYQSTLKLPPIQEDRQHDDQSKRPRLG